MISFFTKSLFSYLLLIIIFFMMYSIAGLATDQMSESFTSFGSLAAILLCIIFVWLFTKAINKIACRISFMYWIFCVGIAIFTLYTNIHSGLSFKIFILHYSGLMFIIPELHGVWTTYLNTETCFDGHGEVIYMDAWITEEYTPGCIRKFFLLVILSFVFYLLQKLWFNDVIWLIFSVEVIFSCALAFINIKNFFFS